MLRLYTLKKEKNEKSCYPGKKKILQKGKDADLTVPRGVAGGR
jgi:hypothetical protein